MSHTTCPLYYEVSMGITSGSKREFYIAPGMYTGIDMYTVELDLHTLVFKSIQAFQFKAFPNQFGSQGLAWQKIQEPLTQGCKPIQSGRGHSMPCLLNMLLKSVYSYIYIGGYNSRQDTCV